MTKRNVDIIIRGRDRGASSAMSKIGRRTGSLTQSLRGLKVAAGAAFAAMGGRAALSFVRESVRLFGIQEKAERRLADALRLVGVASREAVQEQLRFASAMQRVTTMGDEAVLELQALGASLGRLSGQQLMDATRAAIGLSRALGIDAVAAMRLVARAAVGDTAQLTRYGIKLEETLSPQEKFNELLRIGAENFRIAQGEAETMSGQLEQLSNQWGDLKEQLGAGFVPALKELTAAARENQDAMSAWADALAGAVVKLSDAFAASQQIQRGMLTEAIFAFKHLTDERSPFGSLSEAMDGGFAAFRMLEQQRRVRQQGGAGGDGADGQQSGQQPEQQGSGFRGLPGLLGALTTRPRPSVSGGPGLLNLLGVDRNITSESRQAVQEAVEGVESLAGEIGIALRGIIGAQLGRVQAGVGFAQAALGEAAKPELRFTSSFAGQSSRFLTTAPGRKSIEHMDKTSQSAATIVKLIQPFSKKLDDIKAEIAKNQGGQQIVLVPGEID